jgi:hypothetical protein
MSEHLRVPLSSVFDNGQDTSDIKYIDKDELRESNISSKSITVKPGSSKPCSRLKSKRKHSDFTTIEIISDDKLVRTNEDAKISRQIVNTKLDLSSTANTKLESPSLTNTKLELSSLAKTKFGGSSSTLQTHSSMFGRIAHQVSTNFGSLESSYEVGIALDEVDDRKPAAIILFAASHQVARAVLDWSQKIRRNSTELCIHS